MEKIDLRREVERAVAAEWEVFRRAHPRLAEFLDRDLLVEGAQQSLAEDEEYRQAMEQAAAEGLMAEALGEVVRRFVRHWFGGMV